MSEISTGRESLIPSLAAAFDKVADARQLVGKAIPQEAREWAEAAGLEVLEAEFAPPGMLYITGAIPVE